MPESSHKCQQTTATPPVNGTSPNAGHASVSASYRSIRIASARIMRARGYLLTILSLVGRWWITYAHTGATLDYFGTRPI